LSSGTPNQRRIQNEEMNSNSKKTPGEVQGTIQSPHRASHPPSGSVCTLRAMATSI
jgi:hypothetical protein